MLQVPKWLLGLETEIEDQDREPIASEMEDGEEVVGELPEELRTFLFIRRVLYRRMKKLHEKHKEFCTGEGGPACDEYDSQMIRLRDQHDAVDSLFWRSERELFDGLVGSDIAIREGWKVVNCPKEENPGISTLNLFGGGVAIVVSGGTPFDGIRGRHSH